MDDLEDDHVDMAELEAHLYAQIHHDAPETVEQFSAVAKIQQQQQNLSSAPAPNRIVTNNSIVNNNATSGAFSSGGQKKGRYWDNSVGVQKPKPAQFAKPASFQSAPKEHRKPSPSPATSASNQQTASAADYRPKPFTPYTSYLSQIGTTPTPMPSTVLTEPPQPSPREPQVTPSIASLTHAEIRAALKKKNKQIKKKQQHQNKNNPNHPDRRPNPFNRLAENKIRNVQKLRCKKEKATIASTRLQAPVETIDLDSDENHDDDDVICIPVPPPPLVCIESSDEDEESKPEETDDDDEKIVEDDGIHEDFIVQEDRNRLSQNDAFGGLDDEEIAFIGSTVEQAVMASAMGKEFSSAIATDISAVSLPHDTANSTNSNQTETPENSKENSAVFATPKRSTVAKPTYEVSENGFAAVDIYESESSDFPESIYERGKRKEKPTTDDLFDSDVSDIELNIENRLKRRSKRKSCSSNKGSDYMTCSEDEDDDNSDVDIQPAFVESIRTTSTPCVQRGAAVASSKSKIVRQLAASAKRKKRKSVNEHSSDEEFVSMLSCIVHDDKNATNESSGELLSQDVIGARSIVEQTLKKVTEKKNNATEGTAKRSSNWVVTDEVAGDLTAENESEKAMKTTTHVDEFVVVDSVGEVDPIPNNLLEKTCEPNEMEVEADEKDGEGDDDDGKSVPSCSLIVDNPELCWNDEVRSFYNKSWGGENHDQAAIYRGLSKNRSDWKIADEDLFPSTPQTSKRFNARNMRCNNCREKGHRLQECPQPHKPIRCHMCGASGHRESRCPNTLCLRCGNKTNVFTRGCQRCLPMANMYCHQCHAKGHQGRDCPDKWRRYHSTTKPNTPIRKVPILNKLKYCCVCASAGHLAEYCRHALRIMDNPAQPIKIQSYVETYQRLPAADLKPDGSQLDEVASFAFMSVPQEHYAFAWDVNESPDRVYGRIISATQMQRTQFKRISKKRRISANDKEQKTKERRKSKDGESGQKNLVLNPLNMIKKSIKKSVSKPVVEELDESVKEMETEDIPLHTSDDSVNPGETVEMAAVETIDSVIDSTPSVIQVTNVVKDTLDDAFAQVLDIEAIDEAVRVHEQSLKAAQPTEANLDTSNTLCNFSFVSALSEVEQTSTPPKTFTIVALQLDKSTEDPLAESTKLSNVTVTSENFSFATALDETEKQTKTDNPVLNASLDTPETEVRMKTPPPPNISFSSMSDSETLEICTEMQILEKQEQMLNNLKESLKSKKKTKKLSVSERRPDAIEDAVGYHVELNEDIEKTAAEQTSVPEYDSDSNYSFSDYFAKQQNDVINSTREQEKDECEIVSIENSVKMPDFIPIGGEDDEDEDNDLSFIETVVLSDRSVAPLSIPPEKGPSKPIVPGDCSHYSEAKIFLTKDHSKYLLTRSGGAFLTETYTKHNVIVRMEWRNIGNILIVQGLQSDQDKFHADLIAYCTTAEEEIRKKQEISQQVPKNRLTLIRFIKEQISQLEKQLGNVKDCFMRMKISEQQRSKTGNKNADKARRTLNMILLGQTGLRDGPMHLTALQSNLRCLIENETKESISNAFRNEVFQHFKYIFSSHAHEGYAELVDEYEKMRKAKQLPVLRLDRRLLGIKIDVTKPNTAVPVPVINEAEPDLPATNHVEPSRNTTCKTVIAVDTKIIAPLKADMRQNHAAQSKHVDEVASPSTQHALKLKPEESNVPLTGDAPDARNSYVRGSDTLPSKLWSMKCSEYIDKCKAIPKIKANEKAMDKLRNVEVKAKNGAMSFNDFRMLMRIFDKCQ